MSHKSFSPTHTTLESATTQASPTRHELKALKKEKPPGFILEIAWLTFSLLFAKLAVPHAYFALTFVTVLLPMMVYFIVSVLQNLLEFVSLLHMEDFSDDSSILTPNQVSLLFTVIRNLFGYFGLYSISGELDKMVT